MMRSIILKRIINGDDLSHRDDTFEDYPQHVSEALYQLIKAGNFARLDRVLTYNPYIGYNVFVAACESGDPAILRKLLDIQVSGQEMLLADIYDRKIKTTKEVVYVLWEYSSDYIYFNLVSIFKPLSDDYLMRCCDKFGSHRLIDLFPRVFKSFFRRIKHEVTKLELPEVITDLILTTYLALTTNNESSNSKGNC